MTIADHPLRRSGGAALPHPALALGDEAEAHKRLRVAASAADAPASFGGFCGTTELPDFPRPFVIGVRPWTSRCGLPVSAQTDVGPPGSRAKCFRACAGSVTARGPAASCQSDASDVAFRLSPQRRHPGGPAACAAGHGLHGSNPGLRVPLSTLRPCPRGQRRMTRGRRGWLALQRMTLAFTTLRRFNRRTEMS